MATVGEVIDEARDGHESYTERNVPDKVVRRRLNRYQRELYAAIVDADKQWIASDQTIDLDTYDFADGYSPDPAMMRPLGGEVHFENESRTHRLKWVPYKNRKNPTVPWPAYYRNGTVYLCGIEEDWRAVTQVVLHLVAQPTTLSANSDTIDLPDGAIPTMVARAELEMAKRAPISAEGERAPVETAMSLFERAESRFLTEMQEKDRVEETYVREEW